MGADWRRLGVSEPVVAAIRFDWSLLRTEFGAFYAATGFGSEITPAGSPMELLRQTAIEDFYVRNNAAAAREQWKQQTDDPRNPVELVMLAALEASAGSDEALTYISEIRSYEPAEADTLLAL